MTYQEEKAYLEALLEDAYVTTIIVGIGPEAETVAEGMLEIVVNRIHQLENLTQPLIPD